MMIDKSVGLILVVKPDPKGVKEALRAKVGMKRLGLNVVGAVIDGNNDIECPTHIFEDMLNLKIFEVNQKPN